jgi:hypothetical protein
VDATSNTCNSAPPPPVSIPYRPTNNEFTRPSRSPAPARVYRTSQTAPPRPVVEDEVVALAREVSGREVTATVLKANEPPLRGTVEQQPIILESDVSAADAATLHKKLNAEINAEPKDPAAGERRFVLVPSSDTHPPNRDGEDGKSAKSYKESKEKRDVNGDSTKRGGPRDEGPVPSRERRRSRTDLPALETKLPSEAPPFRRSTSAYAYTPTSSESSKTARPSAGDFLLSPEAIPYKGQGRGKGFFDVPATVPRQHSVGGPVDRSSTPVVEKRRSGGSRPSTPTEAKRNSGGFDGYGRKYENGDKLTRPQQLSTENGTRRPDRHPSMQSDRLDTGEDGRGSRKSSTQSSRGYYTESDSDLADSSDSDKPKKKSHRHRKHHRRHQESSLRPDDDRDRHQRSASARSSVDGKSYSRYGSPLPSPKISPNQLPPVDRKETLRDNFQPQRDGRKSNSRPVSPNSAVEAGPSASTFDVSGTKRRTNPRRSSPVTNPGTRSAGNLPSSTLPIVIPSRINLTSPGDTSRQSSKPQYDEETRPAGLRPAGTPQPFWQPPPFQPGDSQYLERPMGSYRRHSQDIENGNIAPLPPCPRTMPLAGHIDWLTLPKCPSFNICPSCFNSTMAPTEFRSHFVPSPMRSMREEVICDFGSQPWYRIAWLLTRKERRRDLQLIYDLAEVSETSPLCVGKHETVRRWHSILDPDTGKPIRNFDVCVHCVKSIEVLLPQLRGLFVRTDHLGPAGLPRQCDMRFDSKRFIHYFDSLETMADASSGSRRPPDARDFAVLAKRFAVIPECSQELTLQGSHWFVITQLPEFTVCPECFDEVVGPEMKKRKAIATMFNRELKSVEKTSCQLYSPTMREIFETAVDENDYKMLASKARERKAAETAWKKSVEDLKRGGKTTKADVAKAEREWRKVE